MTTNALRLIFLVIAVIVIGLMIGEYQSCAEKGGEIVRGMFWLECAKVIKL